MKTYRVWSINVKNHTPMWVMGEYDSKKKAINRARKMIQEASIGNEELKITLFRASISIDNSPDHDCVYLKLRGETVGAVVEAVTSSDEDEDLIYLLIQVLAENFRETDESH